jgi:predicted Rossmann fold nucleotide-binding protein DprA/Smf involved in DNA uptake
MAKNTGDDAIRSVAKLLSKQLVGKPVTEVPRTMAAVEARIARALALLDRVGDAAAEALIKGEAEVFWSKEEAEASEVLTALRNAPPDEPLVDFDEHERFVTRARVWAIKNRAAMDALIAGTAAVVAWPPNGDVVQACADEVNPYADTAKQYGLTVEQVCDILTMFHAAGRLDQERGR